MWQSQRGLKGFFFLPQVAMLVVGGWWVWTHFNNKDSCGYYQYLFWEHLLTSGLCLCLTGEGTIDIRPHNNWLLSSHGCLSAPALVAGLLTLLHLSLFKQQSNTVLFGTEFKKKGKDADKLLQLWVAWWCACATHNRDEKEVRYLTPEQIPSSTQAGGKCLILSVIDYDSLNEILFFFCM